MMPLFDFEVLDTDGKPTGEVVEDVLVPISRVSMTEIVIDGVRLRRKAVSLIADIKTRWGDSHAYYDRDLGTTVSSQRDIDKVCEAKGWVPVADMPKGCLTAGVERMKRKEANDQLVDQQLTDSMARHGAVFGKADTPQEVAAWSRVQAEVMPVHGMLDKSVPAAKTKLTDF